MVFKRKRDGEEISQQTVMIRSQAAAGAGHGRPGLRTMSSFWKAVFTQELLIWKKGLWDTLLCAVASWSDSGELNTHQPLEIYVKL